LAAYAKLTKIFPKQKQTGCGSRHWEARKKTMAITPTYLTWQVRMAHLQMAGNRGGGDDMAFPLVKKIGA
jgi:hypothetical protein